MKLKKYIFLLLLSLAFFNTKAQLLSLSTLTTSGSIEGDNWITTIDANNVTVPGSDYSISSIESDNPQSLIDVSPLLSGLLPLFGWRISVKRDNLNWHDDLDLSVRRSGNGTGSAIIRLGPDIQPEISGGQNYQTITLGSLEFFSGRAKYQEIPIQYKLSGLSVLIPTKTYSTTVTYTIIGL